MTNPRRSSRSRTPRRIALATRSSASGAATGDRDAVPACVHQRVDASAQAACCPRAGAGRTRRRRTDRVHRSNSGGRVIERLRRQPVEAGEPIGDHPGGRRRAAWPRPEHARVPLGEEALRARGASSSSRSRTTGRRCRRTRRGAGANSQTTLRGCCTKYEGKLIGDDEVGVEGHHAPARGRRRRSASRSHTVGSCTSSARCPAASSAVDQVVHVDLGATAHERDLGAAARRCPSADGRAIGEATGLLAARSVRARRSRERRVSPVESGAVERKGRLGFVPARYGDGVVGGAEAVLREMAHGLAQRGWDVDILTTCAPRPLHRGRTSSRPGVERGRRRRRRVRRFPTVISTPPCRAGRVQRGDRRRARRCASASRSDG